MDNYLIKLTNITKKFKKNVIFSNVNITFEQGKIYALIGPNGCGKTLLLKIISGLVRPNDGYVKLNDKILRKDLKILPNMGVIFEKPEFFLDLTGYENLKLLADINHSIDDQEIINILKTVDLFEAKDKKVKFYSLGMVQRLGIAQAIMENQKILLLDEPTNALDETGVKMVHNLLINMKKDRIIIITSHQKYDIDQLADEIYLFNKGSVSKYEKKSL